MPALANTNIVLGQYKTNTHVTAGMALKLVGQTGIEVTIAGADGATACTILGFALETVTGNRAVRIGLGPEVVAIAAGAISVGDPLIVEDVVGRLSAVTVGNLDVGDPVVAIALESANAIDDQIRVQPVMFQTAKS